jgi:hypothetical protein
LESERDQIRRCRQQDHHTLQKVFTECASFFFFPKLFQFVVSSSYFSSAQEWINEDESYDLVAQRKMKTFMATKKFTEWDELFEDAGSVSLLLQLLELICFLLFIFVISHL